MATILIVDDDAALRTAIATALDDLGHQAHQAVDGEAALAWLSAHRADAVLLSPACASLDMFRNYAHRADVFRAAVDEIAIDKGATP